jgi:hypothetical protein
MPEKNTLSVQQGIKFFCKYLNRLQPFVTTFSIDNSIKSQKLVV